MFVKVATQYMNIGLLFCRTNTHEIQTNELLCHYSQTQHLHLNTTLPLREPAPTSVNDSYTAVSQRRNACEDAEGKPDEETQRLFSLYFIIPQYSMLFNRDFVRCTNCCARNS